MPMKMWDVKAGMIKSVKYEDKKGTKILYLKNDIDVNNIEQFKALELAIDTVSKYISGSKLEQEQGENREEIQSLDAVVDNLTEKT